MEKYLEQITPQVSGTWRADEVFIKGNTKYLYALRDDEIRYWIAKQVSDTKYTEDVRPLFVKAKQEQVKDLKLSLPMELETLQKLLQKSSTQEKSHNQDTYAILLSRVKGITTRWNA